MGITEAGIHAPLIGVATTWNEAAPCNITLGRQAQVVKKGVAYVQAGAGLVADSVPEKEYTETVNKARALLTALEIAHLGLDPAPGSFPVKKRKK